MANFVTNQAQITILSTEDSTNNVLVNRAVQPSFDGIMGGGIFYAQTPDTSAHNIPFPLVPISGGQPIEAKHFYIRNLSPAGSTTVLKIDVTPNPGPSGVGSIILGPGDVYLYWQNSSVTTFLAGMQQSISAVAVTGSASGILYEYFLGT